jgi:hypothetical protein
MDITALPQAKLRDNLSEISREVLKGDTAVVVTYHDKPSMAVVSLDIFKLYLSAIANIDLDEIMKSARRNHGGTSRTKR